MDDFKYFINKYKGAIIGAIIAIIFICFEIYKLIISIILIASFAYIGNYVQQNKYDIKEKLKRFIDRI